MTERVYEYFEEEKEDPWKYFKEWQNKKEKERVNVVKNVDCHNDKEKSWQDLTTVNMKDIFIPVSNQGNYFNTKHIRII